MTFYKQLTAFNPTHIIDLRDKKATDEVRVHNSDELRTIGTTAGRTPATGADSKADIDIARHNWKSGVMYTIEFRGKAITRLRLDEGRQIVLCTLDANPDALYFETVEKTDQRQTGVFDVRKLERAYKITLGGTAHIAYLDDFLEGDQRRCYPLYKDERMDGEHYMIRKGRQWDDSRVRPYRGE